MNDAICAILRCPISHLDLSLVEEQRLDDLNARIRKGELKHSSGTPVELELEGALSTSEGQFTYPIVDGILVLLPWLAIVSGKNGTMLGPVDASFETDAAMRFYDEVGWRRVDGGEFADAERFEDLRPVSSDYIHRCHMRVKRHIPPHGKYLLDVASGPLQYREYLTYSEGYEHRICADISLVALRAAKEKLGAKGVYVQCDITRLPLKDGCVDGFLSLHTIYHVPAERQSTAFHELERVLADGKSGVVVYSWGHHCLAMRFLTTTIPFHWMKRVLKAILPKWLIEKLKRATRAQFNTGNEDPPNEPVEKARFWVFSDS